MQHTQSHYLTFAVGDECLCVHEDGALVVLGLVAVVEGSGHHQILQPITIEVQCGQGVPEEHKLVHLTIPLIKRKKVIWFDDWRVDPFSVLIF